MHTPTHKEHGSQITYRVANLAQLQEMIDDMLANARVTLGRKVHPTEITFTDGRSFFAEFALMEKRLSDGSTVFDAEVL